MIAQTIKIITIDDIEVEINPIHITLMLDVKLNEIIGTQIYVNAVVKHSTGELASYSVATASSRKEVKEMIEENNNNLKNVIKELIEELKDED